MPGTVTRGTRAVLVHRAGRVCGFVRRRLVERLPVSRLGVCGACDSEDIKCYGVIFGGG